MLAALNKGEGYPTLTESFGYERLKERLEMQLQRARQPKVGVVRKYGIKTLTDAVALLERLACNDGVDGWVAVVNPRSGKDDETLHFLREAYRAKNLSGYAAIHFATSAPLCVLQVVQHEGSPNSWTAGLSAGAAAVMSMVSRAWWALCSIFCCSGETLIEPSEMAKFQLGTSVPFPTFRESPAWLHPMLDVYQESVEIQRQTMIDACLVLRSTVRRKASDKFSEYTLASLVPLWRNTCRCWTLAEIARLGLWDRRCNHGQGMEDWLHTLIWMQQAIDAKFDWIPICFGGDKGEGVVRYHDERILLADRDLSMREAQIQKFDAEIEALDARIQMFIGEGCFRSVPSEHQEFHIPS